MKFTTATTLATLAALASAAKNERTFAVLRFNGDGFLTEGPMDPVVNPGAQSTHYHSIMGGSNFGTTVEGEQLLDSDCTTAKIKNDKSNYWIPSLYFQDPKNGTFQKVPLFYMNVYYFFEATDDEIVPFPAGLKILSGDANTRSAPKSGALQLDRNSEDPIQPVQWTCPRSSYNPPSYPVNSDGSTAGMVDPNNDGSGAGFPLYPCDGYASPLRQDIHFPSCYNPAKGLDNHKENMAFPRNDGFKQNCDEGEIHVPHMFFEVYWNTPLFDDLWTPDGKTQPFVLSNGDATGYSSHADFISGWDKNTLETIINTCNAGDIGMDKCPQIPGGLNDDQDCKIKLDLTDVLPNGPFANPLSSLPLGNAVSGWGKGGVDSGYQESPASSASSSSPASSTSSSSEAAEATSASDNPVESATYKESETVASPTVEAEATTSATGGAFIESSSSSAAAVETPATTPAPDANNAGGYPTIKTVWDIVTITLTTTVPVPEPTQGVHRRAPKHSHGHAARHLGAGSFAARR